MKTCSKCKEEKPFNEFYKDKSSIDGYAYYCSNCAKKHIIKWKKENKDKSLKIQRKYREKNKEKISKQKKEYREKNKEKLKEYSEKYRKENSEKIKEAQKKYKKNNKDKLKIKNKEYNDKHKDKKKEWRHKNKEKIKGYYEKNKEHLHFIRKKNENKKAKYLRKATKNISWHDYTECAEDGYLIVKCKYCGKKFIPKNKDVRNRAQALVIRGTDTQGLYCSSGCKKACPTYNRTKRYKGQKIEGSSREVQPELRQMCLERDGYTCQKCGDKGKTVQLHCHHIYPLNESPITSADIDNTVTLCKKCHKEVHKGVGCGYYELRCDAA